MAAPWARGAQIRIVGELHGQETVNVFHLATNTVVNDGPDLDALLLQAIEATAQCVVEVLLPAVTSDWKFVQCDGRIIHPAFGDPLVSSGVPENVGELGPTSVSFAASLLRIRTGGGGRRGRGRMYLPPAGEAQIASSVIDGPTLVLLAAFAACLATKFTQGGGGTPWRLGVLSRKNMTAVGGTFDNSFREAQQISAVAEVKRMSSRQRGNGR